MATIETRDVTRRFDGFTALDRVSLAVRPGELVALLGPSGSGKTTLLRVIAGLDFPTEGSVLFDGEDASDQPVGRRRVGFVFQHYALFRHMTVFENVAFGLRVKPRAERPAEAAIRERVDELLGLVQLAPFAHRYPTQLSGGQRQRVALARALAIEPRVLLLDEPFGALDAKVRKDLRRWLRGLHDRMGLTTVFVTHDQEEALEMADRVVVMRDGRIEQEGTPVALYDDPATGFVYRFLGDAVVLPGVVRRGRVEVEGVDVGAAGDSAEGDVELHVRPHDLRVAAGEGEGVPAVVTAVLISGPVARVEARTDGGRTVEAEVARGAGPDIAFAVGDRVSLRPERFGGFAPEARAAPDAAREPAAA